MSGRRLATLLVLLVAAVACERREDPVLFSVALPDLSRSDVSVQAQVRERYTGVMQRLERGPHDAELGLAYGELGVLFHAAEYLDAAEPSYLNAQALRPDDPRWPYYLGHLYKATGATARSVESFERARELQPSDVATLVWLGRTYVDLGRADDAEPLFAKAQTIAPASAAALAGLGQIALARHDYSRAAMLFEQALTANPGAASLHAPLAAAYRGLGETAKADATLERWINTEVPVPDPLRERLATALESGVSYEARGVRAFEIGDFTGAAALFRKGLALTPEETPLGRSLRQKLGLALYLAGDAPGAIDAFERAVELAPDGVPDAPAAQAHYGLGIISASGGRPRAAIEHLEQAVAYDPAYAQARLALADALRREGRYQESLQQYDELARSGMRDAEARFGRAMAMVRLGRWVDARRGLEEAVRAHADRPELAHALARILAAAPDRRARDGDRAFSLVQQLLEESKRTDIGETLAMAYAELGEFERAAAIQRGVLDAAERAGLERDAGRMRANLRLYEQRQPCRMPWTDDDPVHRPGPPVSEALAAISEN